MDSRPIPISIIIASVCDVLRVRPEDLYGNGRHPRVVLARAVVVAVARQWTLYSYPCIACALGRPNHSTVITAHQRVKRQLTIPVRDLWGEQGCHLDGLTVQQVIDTVRDKCVPTEWRTAV